MTNPRGQVFVSYRRSSLAHINSVVGELSVRGVPTWRDIDSLTSTVPTEDTIRKALESADTSGAILWMTPDVIDSPIVRDVEVPLAVKRAKAGDGFWLVAVLTGGLGYADVDKMFNGSLGTTKLSAWNLVRTSDTAATHEDIVGLAGKAVRERISAITAAAGHEHPSQFTVAVDAKGTPAKVRTTRDLHLNWTGQFAAGPPSEEAWVTLTAAVKDVATAVKSALPDNGLVVMDGTPSLPAAVLLGSEFSVREGVRLQWCQRSPNGDSVDPWVIKNGLTGQPALDRGWKVTTSFGDSASTDVALCVNVNASTDSSIGRTEGLPSSWRATVTVDLPTGRNVLDEPLEPDEAVSLVLAAVTELRRARDSVRHVTEVHAFIAAPAGFGAILGTRLGTLPSLVTYEFDTVRQAYSRGVTVRS